METPPETPPPDAFPAAGVDGVLRCLVGYNEWGAYCVPWASRHRRASQRILAGDALERRTIAFVQAHAGDGDIVHAGAYFGDFLLAFARACGAGGHRLWAFEPNPENHRCAAITILLNALDNVTLTHAALGAAAGEAAMIVTDETGLALGGKSQLAVARAAEEAARGSGAAVAGGSSAATVAAATVAAATVIVPVVRVDDVVPPDRLVAVLQLDVEGYEQAALTGALATIRRCRPILLMETVPGADWLAAHLSPLGYRQTGKVHANAIFTAG